MVTETHFVALNVDLLVIPQSDYSALQNEIPPIEKPVKLTQEMNREGTSPYVKKVERLEVRSNLLLTTKCLKVLGDKTIKAKDDKSWCKRNNSRYLFFVFIVADPG